MKKTIIDTLIINFMGNYTCHLYKWTDMWGRKREDYLPDFLVQVDWTTNFDHMVSKWFGWCKNVNDSMAVIARFWCDLDAANKNLLAEWIFKTYNIE